NGLFCRAAQPDSLGEAILKLYKDADLHHKLSMSARASVESILSKERMLEEYSSVMELFKNKQSTFT
ncbi:MAG TPA: hypothetical protein VKZ51_07300, partial [Cyclobacteriaceae bacterium]|nr:hypothetical protein [Cyclobacteriaceae bacterium]